MSWLNPDKLLILFMTLLIGSDCDVSATVSIHGLTNFKLHPHIEISQFRILFIDTFGNLTVCFWKWPIYSGFAHCGSFHSYVNVYQKVWWIWYHLYDHWYWQWNMTIRYDNVFKYIPCMMTIYYNLQSLLTDVLFYELLVSQGLLKPGILVQYSQSKHNYLFL